MISLPDGRSSLDFNPVAPHRLDQVEKKLIEMMSMEKVVAWGECGLDYFDKKTRGQVSWLH